LILVQWVQIPLGILVEELAQRTWDDLVDRFQLKL
jgi:hypothetical protein